MRITMISPSRANTYIDCGLKYKQTYEHDVYSEASHLDLGTIVHAALEKLYTEYGGYADIETLKDVFDKEFQENPRLNTPKHYKEGMGILELYLENPKNFEHDVLEMPDGKPAIELEFYVDLEDGKVYTSMDEAKVAMDSGRYLLRGFIDKVLSTGENSVCVVDYKTSWVMKSNKDLEDDLQLESYNYAIRQLLPWVKDVEVCLNYVRHGEIVSLKKTAKQAETTRRYLLNLFKTIQRDENPVAKLNQYCTWCETKDTCPEFQKLIKGEIKINNMTFDESLDFADVTDSKTQEELWSLKEDIGLRVKLLTKFDDILKEKFQSYLKSTDAKSIIVGEKEVYLSPNKRSYYKYETALELLGPERIEEVLSVTKGKLDKIFKYDKESLDYLNSKSYTFYNDPTLRAKKIPKPKVPKKKK